MLSFKVTLFILLIQKMMTLCLVNLGIFSLSSDLNFFPQTKLCIFKLLLKSCPSIDSSIYVCPQLSMAVFSEETIKPYQIVNVFNTNLSLFLPASFLTLCLSVCLSRHPSLLHLPKLLPATFHQHKQTKSIERRQHFIDWRKRRVLCLFMYVITYLFT